VRNRTFWLLLLLIGALAAAARLAHMASIQGSAYYEFDQSWELSDMRANRLWAEHLASGDWLDREAYRPRFTWEAQVATQETWAEWLGASTYYQPPLYTYLLALGIKITGSPDLFRWAQVLLGAVNVILLGLLGSRVVSRGAGLIAAALAAGYAPFIFYDAELLRGPLAIFLHLLALLALARAASSESPEESPSFGAGPAVSFKAWGLAGAALGIAYIGDSAIVTFIPLAALWAFLAPWRVVAAEGRRPARGDRPGWSARAGALRAGFIAAGLLAALAPLVMRNLAVGAPLLADTTRAPLTFVMGNAPDALPVGAAIPESAIGILRSSRYGALSTIKETLAAHRGDFGAILGLQWRKLQGLFNSYEVPDNPSFYYAALKSPVLARGLRLSCLSGLALVGLLLSARGAGRYALLHLYVAATFSLFLLAYVVSRYRQPLVLPLAIFAGLALVEAWDAVVAGRKAKALAVLVLAALLSFALPASPPPGYRYYRPAEFLVAAGWLDAKGEINEAASEIKEAIRFAREENAGLHASVELGLALGSLYARHDRYPEALSAYRDVLDDDPMNAEALAVAGGIHQDMDQPMQALKYLSLAEIASPSSEEVQARLGYLYWFVFEDGGKALVHLRRSLELAPNGPGASSHSALAAEIAAATTGLTQ